MSNITHIINAKKKLDDKTCKVKAVIIIVKARDPVSRRLKSRSMWICIVQATTTHKGT